MFQKAKQYHFERGMILIYPYAFKHFFDDPKGFEAFVRSKDPQEHVLDLHIMTRDFMKDKHMTIDMENLLLKRTEMEGYWTDNRFGLRYLSGLERLNRTYPQASTSTSIAHTSLNTEQSTSQTNAEGTSYPPFLNDTASVARIEDDFFAAFKKEYHPPARTIRYSITPIHPSTRGTCGSNELRHV